MPDWSLCINAVCPFKKKCWRQHAKPSDFKQSYTKFDPDWKELERSGTTIKDLAMLDPYEYCDNFKEFPNATNR